MLAYLVRPIKAPPGLWRSRSITASPAGRAKSSARTLEKSSPVGQKENLHANAKFPEKTGILQQVHIFQFSEIICFI